MLFSSFCKAHSHLAAITSSEPSPHVPRQLNSSMRKNSIKRQVEAFRTKAIKRRSGWVVDPRTSRMMGFWDAATTVRTRVPDGRCRSTPRAPRPQPPLPPAASQICLVFTALVTPLEVGFFGGAVRQQGRKGGAPPGHLAPGHSYRYSHSYSCC